MNVYPCVDLEMDPSGPTLPVKVFAGNQCPEGQILVAVLPGSNPTSAELFILPQELDGEEEGNRGTWNKWMEKLGWDTLCTTL